MDERRRHAARHPLPRADGLRHPVRLPHACARSASTAASRAKRARNCVRRADGRIERLEGCDETVLEAGEAIIIVTPTGGGFGNP